MRYPHPATFCHPLLAQVPRAVIGPPSPVSIPRVALFIALEAAVATVWGDLSDQQRLAYHQYTCEQEKTAERRAVVAGFLFRVRTLIGVLPLPSTAEPAAPG